jgi:hypothetical protein
MTNHERSEPQNAAKTDDGPHNQPTKIDDPESRGTPIGVVGDLEEMADQQGATTDPAASDAGSGQRDAGHDD